MQVMTTEAARSWCTQEALGLRVRRYDRLTYGQSRPHRFFVAAPELHREIVVLAREMTHGENQVAGGLLWLQRWDIGSPELVRTGWRILEDIRRANGQPAPLEIAPAVLFRDDEAVEQHVFLIQTIAYGWVADFVPRGGGFFLHFKDNRQICFASRSLQIHRELMLAFQRWNPSAEDPMTMKIRSIREARSKRL